MKMKDVRTRVVEWRDRAPVPAFLHEPDGPCGMSA
jgi:hypothetical protein